MKRAASNKSAANQQTSNTSDSKPTKRGTSSFSSKVPRFPTEKIPVGPSPGQYDPIVKDKIKGAMPLSKQLPRSTDPLVPGETLKTSRKNSNVCSNNSSVASFHSTRERSSSGSTYSSSRTPTRGNAARSTIQVPFAPPKRTGIVRTATTGETGARHHHGSSNQATTLRSNTYDAITRTVPTKQAQRLTSGNPVPGATTVCKSPARPSTAGATSAARTGPTIVKTGTRASSATPLPKSRGASPVRRRAASPRPRVASSLVSHTSSVTPSPRSRGASPARRRATSSTPRRQSPSKREELQIKKELNELMARKKAQATSKTSRDTSPAVTGSTRTSSYSRSTAASCSLSSSTTTTTTTTLDYSSQDLEEEEDEEGDYRSRRTWSSPSSQSSHVSLAGALPQTPPPPPEEVSAGAGTGTRRVSTNSNQSDRTMTSWLDKDERTMQQQQAVEMDGEMPAEFSSLTYIVDDEPLRTPLMSCVRKYFTHQTTTGGDEFSSTTATTPAEGAGSSSFGFAYAPEPAVKPFKEMPPQRSYVSNMFEVFAAGVMATSQPSLPHMGDNMLGLGAYHQLSSEVRPSQEVTSLCIKDPPKSSTPPARTPAGTTPVARQRKEPLPRSRQTPCKPAGGNASPKHVAPKSRTVATKTRAVAKSPRRVNETESFPRADMKRKCSTSVVDSFTTPQTDIPVILQKGNKYYLPTRSLLPKPPPNKDAASRPARPGAAAAAAALQSKRARTVEAVARERDRAHVTFKPRSSSAPSEAESCCVAAPTPPQQPPPASDYLEDNEEEGGGTAPFCVEEAEVEISTTSYEEDTPSTRRSVYRLLDTAEQEEELDGAGTSGRSDLSSCGFDLDFVCSENNLTITAKDKRPKSVEKSKSRKNVATTKSRPVDGKPSVKSILVAGKQREQQTQMKPVQSEFRTGEKTPRAKSSPRRVANSKCKSNTRSSSLCESEKSRSYGKIREPDARKSEHSFTSSEYHTGSQSRSRSQSPSPSGSSKRSSSGACTKDTTEKRSAGNVPQTKTTQNDQDRLSVKLEHRGKEGETKCNTIDIQLPKLADDMQTSGNKPAGQYVRDSITLLDVIPMTAQKISETFHKMLEGMRSYLTDTPYINLRRNELHEKMMAYINEADGNAFYIRQEVKTELHRCVTQINANLQELLYLNNCVQEERQISLKKIEELHNREDQLANGLEEYKRLYEGVQKKCDEWAYRCRKEQETRRFIEGSKEMVEKEVAKQRKELRDAEDEVSRLRREIKEFEKKLDEMKKVTLTKDAKFQSKLKFEEKTSQANAELLAKLKDEKGAIQRTLHQMNESHIRLNNQNMAKIQDLEKQLKDTEDALAVERGEKQHMEHQLQKKDDYLKLVEGATVNLVRQTNPGRELPSMPEDFGLNEREVAVWEQLNLCRGRLAELEAENQALQLERLALIEKINDMEHIYQWVQENEGLLKATQNEFTILEQPNAELVEEMEEMRSENKELKEKLAAREKHCSLAHEKIEKLQDLLNSLRISETEDADRVQVATLQHQIGEMKESMREMLERTKELDLRCASQEIQLKQRDYYARNQQHLLETRNQVIEVLKLKGRDVSTLESLMGFGDTWRKNNEPRRSMSGTSEERELRRSPSQLAKNEERILELEQLVVKLEHDETSSHEQRLRLENTIAELELKLLKAERYKHLGIHLIPLSDNIFFCLKRQTHVLACMDDARARVRVVDADIGLPDVEIGRLDELAAGVVTADQFVQFLEIVHSVICENTHHDGGKGSGGKLGRANVADKEGGLKDRNGGKTLDCNCGYEKGGGITIGERPARWSSPNSGGRSPEGRKPRTETTTDSTGQHAAKPHESRLHGLLLLGVSCTENHNIPPPGNDAGDVTNGNTKMFTYEEFDLMLRNVLHEFSKKPEVTHLLSNMTEQDIFHACLHVDFKELREKIRPHLSPDAVRSEIHYRTSETNRAAGTSKSFDVDELWRARGKSNSRAGNEDHKRHERKIGDHESRTGEKPRCSSRGNSPARKDEESSKQTPGQRSRSSSKSPADDRGKDESHARPGLPRTSGGSPDESSGTSGSSSYSIKTMCQELFPCKLEECKHKCQDDHCGKNVAGESQKCVDKPQHIPNYTLFTTPDVHLNNANTGLSETSHRKLDKDLPFDTLSRITESPIESLSGADFVIESKHGNESFGQTKEKRADSDCYSSSIGSSIRGNNKCDLSDSGSRHRNTHTHGSSSGRKLHRTRSMELLSEEESSPGGTSDFVMKHWGPRVRADTPSSTSYNEDGLIARSVHQGKKSVRDYVSARDTLNDDGGSSVSRDTGNSDRETHRIKKRDTTGERRRKHGAVSVSHTSGTSRVFYYPRTRGSSDVGSCSMRPNATKDSTRASRPATPTSTRRQRTERSERKSAREELGGKDKKGRRDRSQSLRRKRSGSRHRYRTAESVGRERRHGREDARGKHGGTDCRPGLSEMLSNPRFVVSLRAINSTVYRGHCSREELEAMRGAAEGLKGEFIKLNEQKSSSTNAARQCGSGSTQESKRSTNKPSRSSVFSTLGEIPAFAKEFFHNFLGGHSTNMRVERDKLNNLPDKQFSYFNNLVDTSDGGRIGHRKLHDSSQEVHGSKVPGTGEKDTKPCLRKSDEPKVVDESKKTHLLNRNRRNDGKFTIENGRVPPRYRLVETEIISSLRSSTVDAGRRNDVETSASSAGAVNLNKPNRISSKNLELASEYLVNKYSVEENVGQENYKRAEVNKLKRIFTNKAKLINREEAAITKKKGGTIEKQVTKSSDVDPSEKDTAMNMGSLPPVSIRNSKGISLKDSKAKENLYNDRSFLFRQLVGDWRDSINRSKKPNRKKAGDASSFPRPDVTAASGGSRNCHRQGDAANIIAERPHRAAPETPSSSDVSGAFELGWFSQTGYRVEPVVALDTATRFDQTGCRVAPAALDTATGFDQTGCRAEPHRHGYRTQATTAATGGGGCEFGTPPPPADGRRGGSVVLTCRPRHIGDTSSADGLVPHDEFLKKYYKEMKVKALTLDKRPHKVLSDKSKVK